MGGRGEIPITFCTRALISRSKLGPRKATSIKIYLGVSVISSSMSAGCVLIRCLSLLNFRSTGENETQLVLFRFYLFSLKKGNDAYQE